MNVSLSTTETNKEAKLLLIKKLEQLGATHIEPSKIGRRELLEFYVNSKKIKTFYNSKRKGDWQLSLNFSENSDPFIRDGVFWILIDLGKNTFFVMPNKWLARNIYDTHEEYKQSHGGERPKNKKSLHHKKSQQEIKQWEEAWNIIFDNEIIFSYSDEIHEEKKYIEGAVTTINVNAYERNQAAREECLKLLGYDCIICGFNFNRFYGNIGKGFIHIHHKVELSSIGQSYSVNPGSDLIPVCPNCHAMLHKRQPPYSVDELKKIIEERSRNIVYELTSDTNDKKSS